MPAPRADLAAEESVLRSWISDREFREAWDPEVDLFFHPLHRAIALVMAKHSGAKRFGEQTLLAELRRANSLKGEVTEASVLHAVSGPVVADPWSDVRNLRELYALRNLQHELTEATAAIGQGATLSEIQGRVRDADAAASDSLGVKIWNTRDIARAVHEHVTSRRPIVYCTSCYERVDRATGGIRPGDGWVLRADTSWGKSTYGGVAVPDENAQRGKRILVVTVEDPPDMYGRRIACRRALVPYWKMRDRKLDPHELGLVQKHLMDLEQLDNLWFMRCVGFSIERICREVRAVIKLHRLHLVVLDYIQKVWTTAKTESRERSLVYSAEAFADTCKTGGAASLILSQMTVNEKGENKTKGAGAIKDMAETVLEGVTTNSGGVVSKSIRTIKVKEGRAGGEYAADWDDDSASFRADVPLELGYGEME